MIENRFSNQTAHTINWFLYSPHVDLESLVRQAENEASTWAIGKSADADKMQDYFLLALEDLVKEAFLAGVGLNGETFTAAAYFGCDESAYQHCDPNWLLLTLFAAMVRNDICFTDVAEAVLAHVRQPAVA